MKMNRNEIIHHVLEPFTDEDGDRNELISSVLRSNTVWTLWEKGENKIYISAYVLSSLNGVWSFNRQLESDPPEKINCPKNYLTKAPVLCDDWRSKVYEYFEKILKIRKEIREKYKQREGRTLRVFLTAEPGNYVSVDKLDIVCIYPGIEGRSPEDGRRYHIPLKLISDIKYIQ
jgi:hypothetical protein